LIRINDIIDKITEYHPQTDLDIIERAYVFSARVHEGQIRLSGEPYLSHPLEVAGILSDMKLDVISVTANFSGLKFSTSFRVLPNSAVFLFTAPVPDRLKAFARCFWQWPMISGLF